MEKKTIIQILIILFLFLISIFIYKFYYNQDNEQTSQSNKIDSLVNKNDNEGQNLIKDIKYISNNSKGDIYEIIADYGETSLENPDLMFLTNVTGNIIFEKKDNIKLISDLGLRDIPTFLLLSLINWIVLDIFSVASGWNVIISAPEFANCFIYLSTGDIIRWTSNIFLVKGLIFLIISGPIVKFGTKWPSITSTWI